MSVWQTHRCSGCGSVLPIHPTATTTRKLCGTPTPYHVYRCRCLRENRRRPRTPHGL